MSNENTDSRTRRWAHRLVSVFGLLAFGCGAEPAPLKYQEGQVVELWDGTRAMITYAPPTPQKIQRYQVRLEGGVSEIVEENEIRSISR